MENDAELLEQAAGEILDGTASPWSPSGASPSSQGLFRQLEVIARITEFHREIAAEPLLRRQWGRLEIRESLGRGAFGEVFRVWDPLLQREVALKLLRSAEEDSSRDAALLREARLLARVRHPNIVVVHEVEQIETEIGLCMELVHGRNLEQTLVQDGLLNEHRAIELGIDLARALRAVHEAGLVHRDVKAQNVMQAEDGRLVLMDFGAGQELGGSISPKGTPVYAAPELLDGQAPTAASDVYSAGVLLFHLVTGSFPVNGDSIQELRAAHSRHDGESLRTLGNRFRRLAPVLTRALAPDPADRYANGAALATALEEAGVASHRRRRLLLLAGAAALLVGLLGTLIYHRVNLKQPEGLAFRQVWTGREVVSDASITPDGRSMVQADWQTGDLVVRNLVTKGLRSLHLGASREKSFAESPVFSPDQRHIAYAWYNHEDGNYQLRVVDAAGMSSPRVVVRNPELTCIQPAGWALDGNSILAVVGRKENTELSWVSAHDGGLKVLKSFGGGGPEHIALSPDGGYIAYDVPQQQDGRDRDIYVIASDGTSESPLVQGPPHEADPCWTPDGSRIVFVSKRSGRTDLWFIPLRGGQPQGNPRIVKKDVGDILSRGGISSKGFTSDGTFFYVQERGDWNVFTSDIDPVAGTSLGPATRLLETHVGKNRGPAWSPDGEWMAFNWVRGDSDKGPGALTLVVRSLETGEEQVFLTPLATINRPVWFHHGLSLLRGVVDHKGRTSFERVDVRTRKRELIRDNAPSFNPGIALAPDDRTVYGSIKGAMKSCCVVRFDLATGKQTRVYAAPDHGKVTGVSLSPDGSTLAIVQSQEDGSRQQVATLRVDGSGIRRLADSLEGSGLAPAMGLAWSHDGQHVYFVRTGENGDAGADAQVWRVPAAGGPPQYTGISEKGLSGINISPDGSRLAFAAGERRGIYPRLLVMAELWSIENLVPTLEASK